jgi:hypothetical protein
MIFKEIIFETVKSYFVKRKIKRILRNITHPVGYENNIIYLPFNLINVKEQLKNNIKSSRLEFDYYNNTLKYVTHFDSKEIEIENEIEKEIFRETILEETYHNIKLNFISIFLLSEEAEEYILSKSDKANGINYIFSFIVELNSSITLKIHLKLKHNYLLQLNSYRNTLTYLINNLK